MLYLTVRYLNLLEQVLELNQELFGIFGLVRNAVQSLRELALQRKRQTYTDNNMSKCLPVK